MFLLFQEKYFQVRNEGVVSSGKGDFAIQLDRGIWHRDDQGIMFKRGKTHHLPKCPAFFQWFFLLIVFLGRGVMVVLDKTF